MERFVVAGTSPVTIAATITLSGTRLNGTGQLGTAKMISKAKISSPRLKGTPTCTNDDPKPHLF
tara:strand:- start:141 stop:332 length:192 start_codon:yes stop_codon:yes gene_type:complete